MDHQKSLYHTLRTGILLCFSLGIAAVISCTHETSLNADTIEPVYFDTEVLPLFQNSCATSGCHDSATRKEGYDLSSYTSIIAKGIKPGDASGSAIYQSITGGEDLMPPGNPLPVEQRNLIRIWIEQGAEEVNDPNTNSTAGGGSGTPGDSTTSGALFCFTKDVHPILVSNCATSGCHDAATHEEGFDFSTYESTIRKGVNPGNASESKIYKVMTTDQYEDDFMPPSPRDPLNTEELSAIRKWINEGALNEVCTASCDPLAIDFTQNIAPIIKSYCEGCHQTSASSGGVTLETQTQIEATARNGSLVNTLNATNGYPKMPPSGSLTDCEIEQITNWVNSIN